jgi:polyisoprenoid-binding protein YceI
MRNRLVRVAVVLSVVSLVPLTSWAQEALQVTGGAVTVVCPMTIGGSFEAKTTAVTGTVTPTKGGTLQGTLAVELVKLETGISLRDRHLRQNYLEVQKGPAFSVAKLDNIKVEKLPGKTTFKGTLTLHGQQREVTGTADVQQDGKGYRVEASFPLLISSFQIPEPKYLGVGVHDEITIKVNLTAVPAAAAAATTASAAGTK